RAAWQRWHESHPEHQRAWRHFDALQSMLQRVPGHLAASTLQASRRSRRRVLRGIGALVGSGAVAGLSWQLAGGQGGVRSWLADYRTGTGERRAVTLADGSELTLNKRTSVDVSMDPTRRLLVLREGEILGLTGLLGAGRTEPALGLFGMRRPDRGSIRLGGRTLALRSNRDAMAAGIAYVPEDRQSIGLNLRQSVQDNLVLAMLPRLSGPLGWLPASRRAATAAQWRDRLH
ncbi:FecR domain-containing protein, partial [Burkholderia sola]|uniref:FecR domain-containing protein n=1 Tax=Burkholderia sola TaxID=2843302 RepID=UPI00338F308A